MSTKKKLLLAAAGNSGTPPGEAMFITAGTYDWVVPAGIESVSIVAIGGGNGAGSANTSSGTSHFNESLYAYGSNGTAGGGRLGADGGGNGGFGAAGDYEMKAGDTGTIYAAGGGAGGAGGYGGNGGNGASSTVDTGNADTIRTAGGGGGGGNGLFGSISSPLGGGGGSKANITWSVSGVSQYNGARGVGRNGGEGGTVTTVGGNYGGGQAGFGGSGDPEFGPSVGTGNPGKGGGGLGWKNDISVTPGETISVKCGAYNGGVRIIWGEGRSFPSTNTTQEFSEVIYIDNVLQ